MRFSRFMPVTRGPFLDHFLHLGVIFSASLRDLVRISLLIVCVFFGIIPCWLPPRMRSLIAVLLTRVPGFWLHFSILRRCLGDQRWSKKGDKKTMKTR